MTDTQIENIKRKAEDLFIEMSFKQINLHNEAIYEYKGGYHKFTFVRGLNGFVMELADSLDEAKKNRFEDGDLYPISLGEKGILIQLRDDINKYYLSY